MRTVSAIPWRSLEERVCRECNRINHLPTWRDVFATVSRLGNGRFWYALMLVLPFMAGRVGLEASVRMLLTGAVCTILYKALKSAVRRPRPCVALPRLDTPIAPLDRFSFPSGHTLHASAFTTVACALLPALAWVLVPFTLLVALSRLVLGLHYLTDVVVGAMIGVALGYAGVLFSGF